MRSLARLPDQLPEDLLEETQDEIARRALRGTMQQENLQVASSTNRVLTVGQTQSQRQEEGQVDTTVRVHEDETELAPALPAANLATIEVRRRAVGE